MTTSIILVGGFPEPVGGVTTFVRRLAASDERIEEVVDIVLGTKKAIPAGYSGRYRRLGNKWRGVVYLFFRMMAWRNKYVHFNFSNLNSLVFFVLLPKIDTQWILMLHNGVFNNHLPNFLVNRLLRRFDRIVYMNETQRESYRFHGVPDHRLVEASSYVRPVHSLPDSVFQKDIDSYFSAKPTFVASGCPEPAYNFDWCIRFVGEREQYQLALFVYGEGPERARIQKQQKTQKNLRVFWDQDEANFNYALSRAKCYLRPNRIDSFGIAVADAVNYGVPVLASDVCPRYPGAHTFKIHTYESFEIALLDLLHHKPAPTACEPNAAIPFSYELVL